MTAEELPDRSPYRRPNGSSWPVPPPDGYTEDDFFTLDLPPHTELIDGSLVFVSPQRAFHTLSMYLLEQGLRQHVPNGLRVRREMAVVLGRRNVPEPDVVVVRARPDRDRRAVAPGSTQPVTGFRTLVPRYSEDHEFSPPVRPCAHR